MAMKGAGSFSLCFVSFASIALYGSASSGSVLYGTSAAVLAFFLLSGGKRLRLPRIRAALAAAGLIFDLFVLFTQLRLIFSLPILCCAAVIIAGVYIAVLRDEVAERFCELALWIMLAYPFFIATALSNSVPGYLEVGFHTPTFFAAFLSPLSAVLAVEAVYPLKKKQALTGCLAGTVWVCLVTMIPDLMFDRIKWHLHPLLTAARISDIPLELWTIGLIGMFFIFRVTVFIKCTYNMLKGRECDNEGEHDKKNIRKRRTRTG